MRANRYIALALALLLALGCFSAAAETRQAAIEADNISISYYSDLLIISREGVEYLAKPDGTVVSDGYDSINEDVWRAFFEVDALEHGNDLNYKGLIDADGRVIVPLQYADVKVLSDRWQLGITVKQVANKADADYESWGLTRYYQIVNLDVYYGAKLVGTLTRDDYSRADAYGDYLYVDSRTGANTFYNKNMEKSSYKSNYSGEYESKYEGDAIVYIHQGTGMRAFCEGCALTEDEVYDIYMADENRAYNLQGDMVCELEEGYRFYNSRFDSRFSEVRQEEKYGVVDVLTGEMLVPVEYDYIDNFWFDENTLDGYALVKKDGKTGYVRRGGEVTCDFVYNDEDVWENGLLSYVNDPEGGVIVLSAVAGILPEKYQKADIYPHIRAFTAENAEGQKALIGLNGKELIPFGAYDSLYVNNSATLAYTYNYDSGEYTVWTIDYADAEEMPAAEEAPAA